jgi:hypothetical protein
MDLSSISSIDKATDRQLLLMILSTQIQIARRLEFIETKVGGEKFEGVQDLTKDIVNKFDTFLERLNDSIEAQHN